jgi:hypothetical protein
MKNKMVFGLGQWLMTLIGMINHGHGDETFVLYYNGFWPNDLSFMIGSFLHLFCSLEKEPVKESGVLFESEPQNTLFQQILQRNPHCLNALKHADKIVGVKPLPRKLFLHMSPDGFFSLANCP